jgi:FKBP-type peptidyl-prolyl cis-trans isomerase
VRNDSSRGDTLFVRPDLSQFTRMSSGLLYRDVRLGTGTPATDFRELALEYNGWLENGTMFDSSRRRDSLFLFTLARDRVIPGWEMGLLGMRAGGRRILHVPPSLAYGPDGRPPVIPPAATLIFDIELHSVR